MTPEGKVKSKVKAMFKRIPRSYAFWPVQMGLGATTLDCLFCVNGYFFAIETKAGTKPFTKRQEFVAKQIEDAGGHALYVNSNTDFQKLEDHIRTLACL